MTREARSAMKWGVFSVALVALLVWLAGCTKPPAVKILPPGPAPSAQNCTLPDPTSPCGDYPIRIIACPYTSPCAYVFDRSAQVYWRGPYDIVFALEDRDTRVFLRYET